MLCCPHCSESSTMLFSIVTPDCGLNQAQQYCSILLTTMNNVGSKALNNAVLTALNRLCVFTRLQWFVLSNECIQYFRNTFITMTIMVRSSNNEQPVADITEGRNSQPTVRLRFWLKRFCLKYSLPTSCVRHWTYIYINARTKFEAQDIIVQVENSN